MNDNPGTARTLGATHTEPALLPRVDVVEDARGITLKADLPGVPRDKLSLEVENDILTLEGEIALEPLEAMGATHVEVDQPRYRRAFKLSKELDGAQVTAELAQGVLTLRIPKAAHAQPRRVEVRVD